VGFTVCNEQRSRITTITARLILELTTRQRPAGVRAESVQAGGSSFGDGWQLRRVQHMLDARYHALVGKLREGTLDRRTFLVRAAALGVSVTVAQGALLGVASARQGTPVAGDLTPKMLGTEGVEHITTTDKGVINIYSSWPMTGASEQIGGDSSESVQYAVDIFGGAAGGFAISYEPLDDGIAANNGSWDAAKETENATMAVNDPDCMAYIATYNSGAAEASIPVTNEAGLAQISPSNTAVALTKESPENPEGYPDVLYASGTRNYMRVCPADDIEGSAGANYAYNTLGSRKAYVLHDNQTYGLGVATEFNDTFLELGGEVLGLEAFDANAPEYQAVMTKIAAAQPDIIYLGAIVNLNASKLLQDMRIQMPADQVAFMGPSGLINQEFIDGAGGAAQDAYITFGGIPPDELEKRGGAGAAWYAGIVERLGRDPDSYAIYAFDCAVCALQAIDTVGEKDRAAILDAMFHTKDFRGLIGTWSFDANGDTSLSTISLNQVIDGQIEFQEVITPPEG
jgi:branched-chain amino acid transport system substrate-binding protein